MTETTPPEPCPFCEIAHGRAPAEVICRWPDVLAIRPLDPVVDGHLLVIPRTHVEDALDDPLVTAMVMHRAARTPANRPGMSAPTGTLLS